MMQESRMEMGGMDHGDSDVLNRNSPSALLSRNTVHQTREYGEY
jgi:hypothetical protein